MVEVHDRTGHLDLSLPDLSVLLASAACEVLRQSVDQNRSLIEQGLDSLTAIDLIESVRRRGYEVDYNLLMDGASIHSLAATLRKGAMDGPTAFPSALTTQPMPLTGPQILWAELEQAGWGSWANISLCVSVPVSTVAAAYLAAMAQSLCAANDALRMVLLQPESADDIVLLQRTIPNFQIPVRMCAAPGLEAAVMRLIEAFEGEEQSPFEPTTRALVLASTTSGGRHWLCITMHHIFADREAVHILTRQLRSMISTGQLHVAPKPALGYADYALWQASVSDGDEARKSKNALQALLAGADVSLRRPMPRLANAAERDFCPLPLVSSLREMDGAALGEVAARLGTTLPLLMHAIFSVLVARLTGDDQAISGATDVLLCHVVSNRERHASLRDLVGCLDTSVPVAVNLSDCDTLQSLSTRTRHAFAKAHAYVCSLPRGGWFGGIENASGENNEARLFERVAHVNITRTPASDAGGRNDVEMKVHAVQRVQQTRWGLLLRVTLPFSLEKTASRSEESSGICVRVFAEHRALATSAHFCFVELMRALLAEPLEQVGEVPVLELVDRVMVVARQVCRAAALAPPSTAGDAFIWNMLAKRQLRWYEHDENYDLRRDKFNRFIGKAANPFPFTQLDKLAEREFLEMHGVPQPRLLHVLPCDNLLYSLPQVASTLPASFVIKPVGAGHSFGVTVVRDGMDISRGDVPFDAPVVAAELSQMAERGYCLHEGRRFLFNFSSFLIEELVEDELGFSLPSDYKVFVIGSTLLWGQLHFKVAGQVWVAFVDANFRLLPQPAWDPITCWRTHRALVCTEQAMIDARKPRCWSGIVQYSTRLGSRLNMFVRLDWYADKTHGPLMGEITTFPHMLQPPSFYSTWANNVVRAAWQDPDGVAPLATASTAGGSGNAVARAEARLSRSEPSRASLLDFFPPRSGAAVWASCSGISYERLYAYVAGFDLAPWGIAGGHCVALLISNGVQLGALLLSTMYRYLALPIDVALPSDAVEAELRGRNASGLVVIAGTDEARKARVVCRNMSELVVIELMLSSASTIAALPPAPDAAVLPPETPALGPDDRLLLLRTSGTTGVQKYVSYTLSRLILAGSGIAQSLNLSWADIGISMLPLHHVGGLACNLIAPLLAGASMHFCRGFDPKVFFDLVGKQGASWCYLVPTLWSMLVEYVDEHPELRRDRPWPRLRVIRSAGSNLPHALALKLSHIFGDGVTVLPTYGMTEAMPIASPGLAYKLDRPGSVGPALPPLKIEIVDFSEGGNCAPVADGAVGEITVAGPTVLPHYEDDVGSRSSVFTPRGYFRTGDLGRLDAGGWLYITERLKNVINRGGETIAPAEVEAVLRTYPGVQNGGANVQILVFGRAHAQLQECVALAVAPHSAQVGLTQIRSWAATRLPPSMLPQTMILLPELPRPDSDKRVRARYANQLRTMLPPSELDRLQVYAVESLSSTLRLVEEIDRPQFTTKSGSGVVDAPDTAIESVLTMVRELLGASVEIGPDTRLAEVGIDSLAAVALSARLSQQFGVQLPPWVISDFPTVRGLVSQLSPATTSFIRAQANGAVASPAAAPAQPVADARSGRLRILMLHGEGSDGRLMGLSMLATGWSHELADVLQFVFVDAPHVCAPKPNFHTGAVKAGLYDKPEYRSWGATTRNTLEASIATVLAALDNLGPVDGIGGICDGGLIAALVASKRSELQMYVNFASSPLERLPADMRDAAWSITVPSLHLISPRDEVLSLRELLQIPERCKRALVLQHEGGHAVPTLDASLKRDVLSMLNGFMFRRQI